MDVKSPIYSFYWSARSFLTPKTVSGMAVRDSSRGARGRLEKWLRLVKGVLWLTRTFVPVAGEQRFSALSSFLVAFGRCWTFGGTRQALAWIKKVRELFLTLLAHPHSSKKTRQVRRRLRRVFGGNSAVVA